MLTLVSVGAGCYSVYVYSRGVGLRHFLPDKINVFLNDTSIFDILVNVFIYRQFMDTVLAVIQPFLKAQSP